MLNSDEISHKFSADGNQFLDDPRFRIRPLQQMLSAVSGALCTSLFMTPLDVVKTRIQAQHKALLSNKCFLYCNGLMDHLCPCGTTSPLTTSKPLHLNGTIDALIKISQSEGVGSLWSGLGPTLVSALPATVIYFVAYEQIKQHSRDYYYRNKPKDKRTMPIFIPLISGMAARILAVSAVSPLELMRTKMQSQRLSYNELKEAIRSVISSDGIFALWRGLPPTIYRDVPFSGIYWSCYEAIKSLFHVTEPSFGFSFFAGAVSGCTAAFVTTPFDVVKTHQQIEFGEKVIYTDKPSKDIPKGSLKAIHEIYLVNGLKGIFAGVMPRLAKVAPACAIMISSFEYGKSFFYKYNIIRYNEENNLRLNYAQND